MVVGVNDEKSAILKGKTGYVPSAVQHIKALDYWYGVSIWERKTSNPRYADETILLMASVTKVVELIQKVKIATGSPYQLLKNETRSDNSRPCRHARRYQWAQCSRKWKSSRIRGYGGSKWCASKKIRPRITLGKSATTRLYNATGNSEITVEVLKTLIRTLVFSIVLYGAETFQL